MRKTTFVGLGILFLLIFSLTFGEILNFYGKISGTATIEAPTFYGSVTNLGGSYYSLYINRLPDEAKGTLALHDGNARFFVSQALNVTSWPPAIWKIFLNIATNEIGNKVDVVLEFIKSDYSSKFQICSQQLFLDSTSNKTYEVDCQSDSISNLSPDDMLQLKIQGIGPTSKYTLYADGSTRIEISYGSQGE